MGSAVDSAWRVTDRDFPAEGSGADRLGFAVRFAILAPSSHNTQPWLFRIDGDTMSVRADRRRALPVVDPDGRELVISCGASLPNLQVALGHFGQEAEAEHVPDPDDRDLLARLSLGGAREPTPSEEALFAAIPKRHTNRKRFRDQAVPNELVRAFQAAAACELAWFAPLLDEERRRAAADLVAEGDRVQFRDKRFRRELAAWSVPNRAPRRDGIPGYALGFGDFASLAGPLVVRALNVGRSRAARDRELAASSPLLGVIGTERDAPADWLAAGRVLERVLLQARSRGVWAAFLNQPIEVPDLRLRVRELAGVAGFPQLLLRMGYGPEPRPTPRRPVSEVLLEP
jgi:hypothetical protein